MEKKRKCILPSGVFVLTLMISAALIFQTCEDPAADLAPTVSISSPAADSTVLIGDTVFVTVNAEDPEGRLADLRFYVNETLIGSSAVSPCTFEWATGGLDEGLYTLRAEAEDRDRHQGEYAIGITLSRLQVAAPSALYLDRVDESSLTLTWKDRQNIGQTYLIERKDGDGDWVGLAEVDSGTVSYTDTGLLNDVIYRYRVGVHSRYGNSEYCTEALSIGSTPAMTDFDGNIYRTVRIGEQVWMAENINVRHYRDGTPISNETSDSIWYFLDTGAYCYYKNDSSYAAVYGALYNWYAVNGDTDGDGVKDHELAPAGWHIPSDAEWQELVDYLGGNTVAGKKLKSTIGWNDDGNGTDEFGFTAYPGGARDYHNNNFYNMGNYAYFWSATAYEESAYYSYYRILNWDNDLIFRGHFNKGAGFSVRCVKDTE